MKHAAIVTLYLMCLGCSHPNLTQWGGFEDRVSAELKYQVYEQVLTEFVSWKTTDPTIAKPTVKEPWMFVLDESTYRSGMNYTHVLAKRFGGTADLYPFDYHSYFHDETSKDVDRLFDGYAYSIRIYFDSYSKPEELRLMVHVGKVGEWYPERIYGVSCVQEECYTGKVRDLVAFNPNTMLRNGTLEELKKRRRMKVCPRRTPEGAVGPNRKGGGNRDPHHLPRCAVPDARP